MPATSLDSIEWHDLPVDAISITESGLSLIVTPYDDVTNSYSSRTLRITEAESLELTINGSLSPKDLGELEVFSFDYESSSPGRISGTFGILPGNAGFWKLSFRNAAWSLADV